MRDSPENQEVLAFGKFSLHVGRGMLREGDRDVRLRPQSYAVLETLVRNHGQLVTKDQIQAEVWGDAVVTDDSLTQCLVDIRRAIGDTEKTFIKTVPRRGFVFDLPVKRIDQHHQARGGNARQRSMQVGIGLALAVAAAFWLILERTSTPSDEVASFDPPENSVAVLPFTDLSDGQELKYFGQSLSEEVITKLSQTPELHVVARTSSFSVPQEGSDIRGISRRLNVRYVLEGSVRQHDGEVRIVAQFIDALTDAHLWSEAFTASMQEPVDVQVNIASAVASELEVQLLGGVTAKRLTDPVTANLVGHARHINNTRKFSQLTQAIELLEEALQRDPDFVPALLELGRTYYQRGLVEQIPAKEALDASFQLMDRALAIAPDDPLANAMMGSRELFYHRNYEESARRYRLAFSADPRNVDVIRGAVPVWLMLGRNQEAIRLAEYLVSHDPLCYLCHQMLLRAYVFAGQYDQAEQHIAVLMAAYPGRPNLDFELTRVYLLQGKDQQAKQVLEGSLEPEHYSWLPFRAILYHRLNDMELHERIMARMEEELGEREPYRLAIAHAGVGNNDAAFRWLERHYETMASSGSIHRDAFIQPLKRDSRWDALISQYTLTDEAFARLDYPTNLPN